MKNGAWKAWGMVAMLIAGIALSALYTSTALGGRVNGNSQSIETIKERQQKVDDQLTWQRNALTAIAFRVGAQLPEEK